MAFSIVLPDADFDIANCIGVIRTPYRYWRLSVPHTADGDGFCSASEIELRSTPGGPDQTGAGCVYTASSENIAGGGTIDKAYDNDASTGWSTTVGPSFPVTNTVDFGAGNEKDIQEASWMVSSFAPNRAPAAIDVEYSADGVTFAIAWSVVGISGWVGDVPKVFTRPS